MPVEHIIIAGGGPVGALMALLLAKQGYTAEVYDKRDRPERSPSPDNTQAYLLNANTRTLQTFEENSIAIEPLISRSGGLLRQQFLRQDGSVYHTVEAPVTKEKPMMMRVFRDEIARHLIDEAERLYPSKVKFHFNQGVSEVDLAAKSVTITGDSGSKEVKYDLLVGADGAGSKVRAAIQQNSEPNFLKRRGHDTVYTTGNLKAPAGAFPKHTIFTLHAFEVGAAMVNGRGDGDVRVALFLPKHFADQLSSGDNADIREKVENGLPGLNEYAKKAVLKIVDHPGPFHPISGWTYLSRLYGPSTLLIGDAAHTMTPMLGQGCNSGLEDARLFAQVLEKHPEDLERALKEYNNLRLPDIQALLKLNEIAASERHLILSDESVVLHKLWVKSHSAMLSIHQGLGKFLQRSFPSVFGPPVLVRALMGKTPYRRVIPAMYRDTLFVTLATAATGVAVFTGAKVLLQRA